MRHYHIWYYGQPQADAMPFTTLIGASKELARQLDVAAEQGEYPTAQIVSIGKTHKDIRIEVPFSASQNDK